MEKTRPILYGVADYAQIRRKNEILLTIEVILNPH